jgi:hypothetical protein
MKRNISLLIAVILMAFIISLSLNVYGIPFRVNELLRNLFIAPFFYFLIKGFNVEKPLVLEASLFGSCVVLLLNRHYDIFVLYNLLCLIGGYFILYVTKKLLQKP